MEQPRRLPPILALLGLPVLPPALLPVVAHAQTAVAAAQNPAGREAEPPATSTPVGPADPAPAPLTGPAKPRVRTTLGSSLSIVIADTGPLATVSAPVPVAPTPPTGTRAADAGFQAAPLPNPDITPPLGAGPTGPALAPAFFNRKTEFTGDGFAHGSSLDDAQKRKRTGAAGLNWSVPVK